MSIVAELTTISSVLIRHRLDIKNVRGDTLGDDECFGSDLFNFNFFNSLSKLVL